MKDNKPDHQTASRFRRATWGLASSLAVMASPLAAYAAQAPAQPKVQSQAQTKAPAQPQPPAVLPPSTGVADYGIDPTLSLRSRIGPPTDLVVATYVEAGASDITAHTMTDEDWAIVERALSRLPALHQKILQQRLRRLSFVDLRPGAGSALTSPAGPIATATAFDMTFRSSLLRESLSDFLNTKEATSSRTTPQERASSSTPARWTP